MRKLAAFAFSLALFFTWSVVAQNRQLVQESDPTEIRTALVIGNAAYANSPLKNPINDATDIAAALRDTGFEVIYKTNLNQTEMKRAIREFGTKLRTKGGVGLFYFAGHGIQVNGTNYLVPISATFNSEEEVEYEAVDAGFVLAQMEASQNPMNIVILDACRNNPFSRSFRSQSQGLAQMDAPSGTIIAYATAPGSVASDGPGRNGLYTQELLKNIRTSNLGIEEVFKRVRISVLSSTEGKQTPWESSSLTGSFRFTVSKNQPIPAGGSSGSISQPVDLGPSAKTIELTFWNSIKDSTNPESFRAYLRKYPNGDFAEIARIKIQSLTEGAKPDPQISRQTPGNEGVVGIGTYVPALNAKVTNLLFFESPQELTPSDKRVYATRFPLNSRFICWQIEFEFPKQTARRDFRIRAIYYDSKNTALQTQEVDTYFEKGWENSMVAKGWGHSDGYSYGAGKYRVDVYYGNIKLASGWFEVF
ncbi:MAG: caspase domain-containing protein [Pyrinomonadaceae bacterium]